MTKEQKKTLIDSECENLKMSWTYTCGRFGDSDIENVRRCMELINQNTCINQKDMHLLAQAFWSCIVETKKKGGI